jgi:hypothetical protein
MTQDTKTSPADVVLPHASARQIADRFRLMSIGNEELKDLKKARADGRLRPYRVIETGSKRSIIEVDDDKQVAIAMLAAKSGAPIDRNPARAAPQPSPAPSSSPRRAGGSGVGLASRPAPSARPASRRAAASEPTSADALFGGAFFAALSK